MLYSVNWKGQVLDFNYKKLGASGLQAFYVGDIYVGQVSHLGRSGWTAACDTSPCDIMPVHGFKSRYAASEFLLKLNGMYT